MELDDTPGRMKTMRGLLLAVLRGLRFRLLLALPAALLLLVIEIFKTIPPYSFQIVFLIYVCIALALLYRSTKSLLQDLRGGGDDSN